MFGRQFQSVESIKPLVLRYKKRNQESGCSNDIGLQSADIAAPGEVVRGTPLHKSYNTGARRLYETVMGLTSGDEGMLLCNVVTGSVSGNLTHGPSRRSDCSLLRDQSIQQNKCDSKVALSNLPIPF